MIGHEGTGDVKPDDLKFIGVECDVSSEISVQKAFSEVMNTFGRLDSVVASAGEAFFVIYSTVDADIHLLGIVENYSAFESVFCVMGQTPDIDVPQLPL